MPFLFTRLSSPCSLSLSSHLRNSDALMISRAISWTSLQCVSIFPVLGSPELDPELQLWPHQCWPEGKDHPLWPAGYILHHAAQGATDHLCSKGQLLQWRWHCWLGISSSYIRTSRPFSAHTSEPPGPSEPSGWSSWSTPSLYWCSGLILYSYTSQFLFIEVHEIPTCPFLQAVKVPLDGHTTFWCIFHSSQICLIFKVVICPIIPIINEEVTRYWPPTLSPCVLGTCPQLDLLPLTTTLWTWSFWQFSVHPTVLLPNIHIDSLFMRVCQEIMSNAFLALKCFRVNNLHCSPFSHCAGHLIAEACQSP